MTTNHTAKERAAMPAGTHVLLDRRTIENSNQNLLKLLKPGMRVLDVGCGSGSITKGIAEKVGPDGKAIGIDVSEHLISVAKENYPKQQNLSFDIADILTYSTLEPFDLITSARVLQWIANPVKVLEKMKDLLKPGGITAILDYNHEKITWQPEPPQSMKKFYAAFLQWRKEAGFDNAIADHVKDMMKQIGLTNVEVSNQFENCSKQDPDFSEKSGIWSEVARLRGPQVVKAGYCTEEERITALEEYDQWIQTTGQSMQLYLLAVEGRW